MIFKNAKFERGFYTAMRGEPNWLPLPFPRFFTKQSFDESGRCLLPDGSKEEIAKVREKIKDEFVMSVPTLVKIAQDGSYHARIEQAYTEIKSMKLPVKFQLLKEANLEEDELAEIKENLANLVEAYKAINMDSDQEEDEGSDY